MPKIDFAAIPPVNRTGYPPPYDKAVEGRWQRKVGLEDFGVNHVTLDPGAWSSQRHWHEAEDELVIILSGRAVLIDDDGRTEMGPGDVAVFPKGDGNGHRLVNETEAQCVFVAVGRTAEGPCHYPDIDLHLPGGGSGYTRKNGGQY